MDTALLLKLHQLKLLMKKQRENIRRAAQVTFKEFFTS
jgi:hypothetical protein